MVSLRGRKHSKRGGILKPLILLSILCICNLSSAAVEIFVSRFVDSEAQFWWKVWTIPVWIRAVQWTRFPKEDNNYVIGTLYTSESSYTRIRLCNVKNTSFAAYESILPSLWNECESICNCLTRLSLLDNFLLSNI